MKILILNHEFPPAGGGAANATQAIATALVELGHNPQVITSRHPKSVIPQQNNPFPVVFVPPRRSKLESPSINIILHRRVWGEKFTESKSHPDTMRPHENPR